MFETRNYFELLGINEVFEIEQESLYQNYLKLQHILHPDKLANNSHAEKVIALEYASKLNHAYEILKDDKKRAEYLLSLHDVVVNMEEGNNVHPDPMMLMEILELSEDHQGIDIDSLKQECWDVFKINYANANYQEAAQGIIKLQYLNKL